MNEHLHFTDSFDASEFGATQRLAFKVSTETSPPLLPTGVDPAKVDKVEEEQENTGAFEEAIVNIGKAAMQPFFNGIDGMSELTQPGGVRASDADK